MVLQHAPRSNLNVMSVVAGSVWRGLYQRRWPAPYRRLVLNTRNGPAPYGWKHRYRHQLSHRQVWKEGKRVTQQFASGLASLACVQSVAGPLDCALLIWCDSRELRWRTMFRLIFVGTSLQRGSGRVGGG
jgi:hypothetical protein